MSELEDKINSILSSPEEMEKISRLASQLMGGTIPEKPGVQKPDEEKSDEEMLGKLQKMVQKAAGGGSDKTGLIKALSPYLREDRRQKLQKAVRLAQAARLAGIAMNELGG